MCAVRCSLNQIIRTAYSLRLMSTAQTESTTSGVSAAYAVESVNQADRVDGNGFRVEGIDRRGQPYGAVSALMTAAYMGTQQVVDERLGQYAKYRCSSVVCNDQLGMKVVGDHFVTWFAVCTGRAVESTEENPVFELFVVSAGRVVSMTAGCLPDNTAPWHGSSLGWVRGHRRVAEESCQSGMGATTVAPSGQRWRQSTVSGACSHQFWRRQWLVSWPSVRAQCEWVRPMVEVCQLDRESLREQCRSHQA